MATLRFIGGLPVPRVSGLYGVFVSVQALQTWAIVLKLCLEEISGVPYEHQKGLAAGG
jgi:hypothetical protein